MAQGMLGNLFAPQKEEEYTPMTIGEAQGRGAQMAGRGLAQGLGALAGRDVRPQGQIRRDAIERVKAKITASGAEAGSDEFYKAVMMALQQEGFPAEALAVAQEWQVNKRAGVKEDLSIREQQRKESKDVALNEQAVERNRIANERLGTQGPETLKLLDRLDQTTDPNARKAIMARVNALAAGKGVKFEDLGDRVIVVDAGTGQQLRVDMKGIGPAAAAKAEKTDAKLNQAYEAAKQTLQEKYDSAVELYNMPGLDSIAGTRGAFLGDPDSNAYKAAVLTMGSDGAAALAKHQQVVSGSFLTAFTEIKAASPTGSSGLGALSDAEGKKLETAKAALALNTGQSAASLRNNLKQYVEAMANTSALFDKYAPEGAAVVPLRPGSLTGAPAKAKAASVAKTATPVAKTATPAAPAGKEQWVRGPDGKLTKRP